MEDKLRGIDIHKGSNFGADLNDDDDDDGDDDEDLENNETEEVIFSVSMDEKSKSPPRLIRKSQKETLKFKESKHRGSFGSVSKYETKPKRPDFVHSSNFEHETTDFTDSLQHEQEQFNESIKSEPSSAPVSMDKIVWRFSVPYDPIFDRDSKRKKIDNLLKIALKNSQKIHPIVPPPPTPIPILSHSPISCSLPMTITHNNNDIDKLKMQLADKIWKEIFDYFEFYDRRAETNEELDERIEQIRNEIPLKINNILNINYSMITDDMDKDIRNTIKTFLDYSKLYDKKIYIDRLCYLNLLVQDNLNSICYIESLYPSTRILKQEQNAYGTSKFQATAKTLLLWHKIVEDLMIKSDQLGKFLGFAKRQEYLEYWNWFDQRLKYSRREYEKVQEWLNSSINLSQSNLTLVNQSSDQSNITSPIILLTKPTFCSIESNSKINEANIQRQISCLIKRLDGKETETIRSSLSVNILSEATSPESNAIQLDQNDHLLKAKMQHVNSYFINKNPQQFIDQQISNEPVRFDLDETEEEIQKIDNENDSESMSFFESDSFTTQTENEKQTENRKKIFRDFLRKRLRKFGLTQTCDKIRQVLLGSLSHALLALQIDKCERNALNHISDYHLMPLHHKCRELIQQFYHDEESIKYGVHSDTFKRLGLPSFKPLFIYLNNVILDLMHLCIEMQNENKGDIKFINTDFEFSLLSIEVLTNECRECIEQAILVRQFYYHMIYSVSENDEKEQFDVQQRLDKDLYEFDEDLKKTITIYLSFITDWVQQLIHISDLPKALRVLENEWKFCKNNLYFVTASEDIYASPFCAMSLQVYGSLIHMFNHIDAEYKDPLREEIDCIDNKELIQSAGVDLDSLVSSFPAYTMEEKNENEEEEENDDEDYNEDENNDEYSLNEYKRQVSNHSNSSNDKLNMKFNEFKEEINKLRKYCLRALDFSAEFLSDLELAAKYQVVSDIHQLLYKLNLTNHVMIKFTNEELTLESSESSFLIFVPQEFAKDKVQIVRLLFIISEKDEYEPSKDHQNTTAKSEKNVTNQKNIVRRLSSSNSIFDPFNQDQRDLRKLSEFVNKIGPVISGRSSPVNSQTHNVQNTFLISPTHNTDGYLLYLQLSDSKHEFERAWKGHVIDLHASPPVKRSLYQHLKPINENKLNYLYLVTSKQSILNIKKSEIERKLHGTITLIKEKASFHPTIDNSISELKSTIFKLRDECIKWIKTTEDELKTTSNSDQTSNKAKISRNVNEILRVSYIFGIELQNEITKFMTHDQASDFALGLADFSIQWCEYIISKTARGKGRTARPWAANKGLHLVKVAVDYSTYLGDWEFQKLLQSVEKCISHLIGENETETENFLSPSNPNISISRTSLNRYAKKQNKLQPPNKRFGEQSITVDSFRENNLLNGRYIGKILENNRQDSIINGTEVQFRWQLGLLIGEGSFGKVYSCVNLDTCEPMALKIIEFKTNADAETIKGIADEINNVVDINHENLVKVYGSELHRKEILIFMEFCGDQSTLDRLSRDASGLPEKLVRHYTKSLLKAVEHLHENKIIHRDIKGANIFLKSIDNKNPEKVVLKLGDFGCSIRLKDPIGTGSRDQATGLRGTYAFMAPEVMASGGTKDAGYTYSADIWSVGCVVIEMFTGKRPWHPFKDEAILWKVHLASDGQKKPPYPSPLSNEPEDFLNCCFEFDPKNRKAADQLLEHRFVMVPEED